MYVVGYLQDVLVRAADLTSSGIVALTVLYDPSTSMSMTDLKALALSWLMGARKLPAAPALFSFCQSYTTPGFRPVTSCRQEVDLHHIIYSPKFADTFFNRLLQAFHIPHVYCTDAEHSRTIARCGEVFGHGFGLLDVASYDAGVCAEVEEGSDLSAADCASAAGAEDDAVIYMQ